MDSKKSDAGDLDLHELDPEGGYQKLSFAKYPLQFWLCLVDTIEPIKRFCDYIRGDEYWILNSISIDIKYCENDKCKIVIKHNKILKKEKDFCRWKNDICGLTSWMLCDVKEENNGFIICFNVNE